MLTPREPAGDGMDISLAATALAALGHSLRLEVWRMLMPLGPIGLPAGVIASRLAVAPSSLSFHLQQMTQGRVLVQRRSSRQIIYAVDGEVISALREFLAGGNSILLPPGALINGQPGDVISDR
jgi:ArsR family transcriptional regulator